MLDTVQTCGDWTVSFYICQGLDLPLCRSGRIGPAPGIRGEGVRKVRRDQRGEFAVGQTPRGLQAILAEALQPGVCSYVLY